MELLADRGVDQTWRRSIAEALAVIDLLDERVAPLERELRRAAAVDARVVLLKTLPGVGDLLCLTLASEIGDVARFATPRKLIGYAGLAPRVHQCVRALAHRRALKGGIAHAALGGRRGRARRLATDQPLARALQRHRPACRQERRQVRGRTQDPDRLLAHPEPSATLQTGPLLSERHRGLGKLQLLSGRLTAPHGIEKPRQLPRTICAPSAEREMSKRSTPTGANTAERRHLDSRPSFKEKAEAKSAVSDLGSRTRVSREAIVTGTACGSAVERAS